jgi:DNA-binding NtrC family response regulator
MPAQIVVVLDDPDFSSRLVTRLGEAGHKTRAVPDSLTALDVLEDGSSTDVLVTSLDHAIGKPNGIALALMARKRRPDIRVLFVGLDHLASHAAGLGAFLAAPVTVSDVTEQIIELLEAGSPVE